MDWQRGERAVGITIGNAQARAAVYEGNRAEIIPLDDGERQMPSTVLLHRLREVGKYAYLYSGTDPDLLVGSLNRLLGRNYQQLEPELQRLALQTRNNNNRVRIVDWLGGFYSPIELYAMIARKLKQAVERYIKQECHQAVIAVPGSFDDYQRRSVRVAAESVFQSVKLINEPTAAALVMADNINLTRQQHLLTCDIGAGKCEVAIIERTAQHHLRIKAITGDTHLGGDDVDHLIFNEIAQQFQRTHQEPLIGDSAMARHEVMMAIRAAKHQLEQVNTASINVPFVNFDRFGKPLHLSTEISRRRLEQLCADLKYRIENLINACLADAGNVTIDQIYLLGGSTRLPFISGLLAQYLRKPSLRIENPDEIAVQGACLYAAQLQGEYHGLVIEDLTAHSLGITTFEGSMGFVLRRQSRVPAAITKRFKTVYDNQREVHIEVREGEADQARGNRVIGDFLLPLPPRLPRNSPIEVTIGKDEDGIVLVRAHDPAAGTTREITINYEL